MVSEPLSSGPLIRHRERSLAATGFIRLRLAMQQLRHRLAYGAAAPRPRRCIKIDPARIEHVVHPPLHRIRNISKSGTYIIDGSWDRAPTAAEPWFASRAIEDTPPRLLSLEAYAFTEAIEAAPAGFDAFASTWSDQIDRLSTEGAEEYLSEEAIRTYYDLYVDMAESGYRTWPAVGHRRPYPAYHEVAVAIGRSGTIYSAGFNKHRLVIARHLGLDTIPVRVHVRHADWQAQRMAAIGGSRSDSTATGHPDIRGLTSRG